jgi:hypothetical protein
MGMYTVVKGLQDLVWLMTRHDRTLRQPMNLKREFSVPVLSVPFVTSWYHHINDQQMGNNGY